MLHFESIGTDLVNEFPELRAPFGRFVAAGESGQYVLFEDLFRVYVSELLACPDSKARQQKLGKVFQFTEQMLEAGGEVENLAFIAIFEGQPGSWLQCAKQFLGPRAEEALDRYDYNWRQRALASSHLLDTSDRIDLYGAKIIARDICANA